MINVLEKGNKSICSNYKGTALLLTIYKVYEEKLQSTAENILGEEQCGFCRG
jgi:hypothetical protein